MKCSDVGETSEHFLYSFTLTFIALTKVVVALADDAG